MDNSNKGFNNIRLNYRATRLDKSSKINMLAAASKKD